MPGQVFQCVAWPGPTFNRGTGGHCGCDLAKESQQLTELLPLYPTAQQGSFQGGRPPVSCASAGLQINLLAPGDSWVTRVEGGKVAFFVRQVSFLK